MPIRCECFKPLASMIKNFLFPGLTARLLHFSTNLHIICKQSALRPSLRRRATCNSLARHLHALMHLCASFWTFLVQKNAFFKSNTLVKINKTPKIRVFVLSFSVFYALWSHLGLNQGPPDYESGALTN